MQLMDGQDPQSLGIWRSKQGLYQQACRRHSNVHTAEWPAFLYRCDQAIKGLVQQPAWGLLLQAALELSVKGYLKVQSNFGCGHIIFFSVTLNIASVK